MHVHTTPPKESQGVWLQLTPPIHFTTVVATGLVMGTLGKPKASISFCDQLQHTTATRCLRGVDFSLLLLQDPGHASVSSHLDTPTIQTFLLGPAGPKVLLQQCSPLTAVSTQQASKQTCVTTPAYYVGPPKKKEHMET